MINRYIILGVAFGLVLLSSCRRELAESIQSAEDNAQIETEYAQIYDIVGDYVSTDNRTKKTEEVILPNGAVVLFQDSTFDDGDGIDFTINYGPLNHDSTYKGILCKDGRYRAGLVKVGMDKRWSDLPCTITIAISSANEYYTGNGSNMYKVTGTKTISRTASNIYSVNVSNATLQRDNGTVNWSAQRTITVTNSPISWWGTEYEVTGSASGTNANGEPFTVQILNPLQKRIAVGCLSTFVAGELKLTNTGSDKELTVNYDPYGTQTCDKVVRVTFNGKNYTITLW